MTVIADILTHPTLDSSLPRVSSDNHIYEELAARQDFAYPAGTPLEDEIQEIAIFNGTATGGNYTLTIKLQDGTEFTTGNILYTATAATIESAIDAASPASVPNGDISVSGGPLTTTPVVLIYDGSSVDEQNHAVVVITDVNLVGATPGATTTTTQGGGNRRGLAALVGMGVVVDVPDFRDAPESWSVRTSAETENYPSPGLVSFLADLYYFEEDNLTGYKTLRTALGV